MVKNRNNKSDGDHFGSPCKYTVKGLLLHEIRSNIMNTTLTEANPGTRVNRILFTAEYGVLFIANTNLLAIANPRRRWQAIKKSEIIMAQLFYVPYMLRCETK